MESTLRIHLITQEDPFYLPTFFREFFAGLPREHLEVTGVDITPPLNRANRGKLARRLYGFYGPTDFLRLGARYAVATVRDAVLPLRAWDGTVRRIASAHGVRSRIIRDVNAPEYVEHLRGLRLDLLVSVAASQIFRRELLTVPRLAAINIHTGRLPAYRGMLPVFWQMLDGRDSVGITIHTMTAEVDIGELLFQCEVPYNPADSLDAVIREMKRQGALAMLELLREYAAGTVTSAPMDRGEAVYRSFPDRAAARAFRARGLRLL